MSEKMRDSMMVSVEGIRMMACARPSEIPPDKIEMYMEDAFRDVDDMLRHYDALTQENERLRNPWLPIPADDSLPKIDQWQGCMLVVGEKRKPSVFRWLSVTGVWVSANYEFDTSADFTRNGFTHYMLIPSLPEGGS